MNKNMSEESHKKIFISHSSKDKQIVDIFVDKLLHLGLQIDPNDVAYTSREETGVGTGEDIRKFIKENISTCDFVFFMISENYKKSEICIINFTAGSGFVWDFLPCRFDGLPLYPEKYRETHFLTYSLRGMGSSWLNPNAGRLRISLKATLRTTPNSFV